MNDRNVKALEEILANYPDNGADRFDTPSLAKYLVGLGVLVPSALTEQESAGLIRFIERTRLMDLLSDSPHGAGHVPVELERIAKGEKVKTKRATQRGTAVADSG